VLRDLGRPQEAAEALGQALALDPDTAAIKVNYGAALLDAKRT
jgi:predicted Zn-dependent protease